MHYGTAVSSLSRRQFVKAASACGCAFGLHAHATSILRFGPSLQCFGYQDVRLTEGPLLAQHQEQQRLFLGLEDDALLKPFRHRAGLAAPGPDMGGWYDDSADFHIDPNDWSSANWHGFIPGHSFGQYVSGLARGFAASGDAATRRKIESLVGQYAATISPKFFDDYNLPAYTFDKLVIGLVDAHRYANVAGARDALARLADSALPFLPHKALTREERRALPYRREAQIWDEPYTLPENLLLAAQQGLGDRYRKLGEKYLPDDSLVDALAGNRSPFKGKHAYSHVNALSSAFQAWLSTGDTKYLLAAIHGFDFVEAQSYATGGWGPNEELLAPDDSQTLYTMLGDTHRHFETPCGAYAHFKITRSLLQATRNPRYGDSMERVLYNTILGALGTQRDGRTFYYSDYSSDATKVYRGEAWPCCSGTFVQLAADYGISAYFHDTKNVYVNLYVPSRLSADIQGQPVIVEQATKYPFDVVSRLTLEVRKPSSFRLNLRIPAWAGSQTSIRTNGKAAEAPRPGSFHPIDRTWKSGDVVEIRFDMQNALSPLNVAHPEMVALTHGPLVLFPVEPPDAKLTGADLLRAARVSEHEWRLDAGGIRHRFKPFAAISNERYRLYTRVAAS